MILTMARESESMTQDASALIRHLLEQRADKSRMELVALRSTLAAALQALEDAVTPSASGDDEIAALVEQFAHAAAAEAERAANESARISAENEQLAAALTAVRQQLQADERERAALARELHSSNTLVDELRTAAAAESERAAKEIERFTAENAQLAAGLAEAQQQLQSIERQREEFVHEFQASASRIEALESALGEHARRLSIDQLVPALEQVGRATTVPDTLTAVAHALTNHFPRVAVFAVQDGHLQGMYQTGFEFSHDISKIVAPLTMDSLLAASASSDKVQALTAEDLAGNLGVPFGGDPACAVLFPVSMNGATHGVVYADDGGDTRHDHAPVDHRAALADVVRRYAAAHIERLSAGLKGVTELRGYAKWLLDEVEGLYTADVAAGIAGAELRMCLQAHLECARQIHARRAELEGAADTTIFDEQIVSLVQATPGSPFTRDLLALTADASGAADQSNAPAAQAS